MDLIKFVSLAMDICSEDNPLYQTDL